MRAICSPAVRHSIDANGDAHTDFTYRDMQSMRHMSSRFNGILNEHDALHALMGLRRRSAYNGELT